MNLLDKFDQLQVTNTSRIDADDKTFCELWDSIYSESLDCYKSILNKMISVHNFQLPRVKQKHELYIDMYGDFGINDCMARIIKIKNIFIGKICWYFSKKYNITIDDNKIYTKYKDVEKRDKNNKDGTLILNPIEYKPIDYNIIVDEIIIQLNGFNFKEKAIDEIKKKAKMELRWYDYRKYWSYEVKGKTIKFHYNIDNVYPALYFYDNNEIDIIDCFTHNRISDYKSFDNGNTDIKFVNESYALDFAKRYLGYIEMTEAEKEAFKKNNRW
jgi:hypothetical protein